MNGEINFSEMFKAPEQKTTVYKLKNGDIFAVDIGTFIEDRMYKCPYIKRLTIEEIYEAHLNPPSYGMIMVRFEKEDVEDKELLDKIKKTPVTILPKVDFKNKDYYLGFYDGVNRCAARYKDIILFDYLLGYYDGVTATKGEINGRTV